MNPLIVMDPALGRAGDHYLAFAEMLVAQKDARSLGVCGNVAMDESLRRRLAQRCELVEGTFDLDFHALAGKSGSAGEHWSWIYGLAKAYTASFERMLAHWPGRLLRILHPSLSWEHANALALGIRSLGSRGKRLRHIVLLMHSPGVNGAGRTLEPQCRLNFSIAFKALCRSGQVDLYANCQEHAQAYMHLLELPEPLLLHPHIDYGVEGKANSRTLPHQFLDWLDIAPEPVCAQTPVARARALRTASPKVGGGTDIVLFWKQNDSTLYGRRNDMVARYLASRADVRRVLVLDAPIDEKRLAAMAASGDPLRHDRWIADRTLEKLSGRLDEGKLAYSVFVHPREGYGPDEQNLPSADFLGAYEAFLREEFAHWDIDPARSVFWIYPRNFALSPLLPRLSPARVIVDVVDDHRAWPGLDEAEKVRLGVNYRELLAQADLALANCESVREAMSELGRTPLLVPNGSDAPLPVHTGNAGEALHEHLAFAGRTLGFVGNLEAKIDTDLLSRLAEAFPNCRLVLVGSTHANPEVKSLLRYPNVRMPGVVPYDKLGAWLSRFDVGLIPHRQMELTRYMNPLKAYVYLANGVPVVATEVPNVEPVPGLLTVASDTEAFVAAVANYLAAGRQPRERFEAFSAAHSWAARLDSHLDAIGLGAMGKGAA